MHDYIIIYVYVHTYILYMNIIDVIYSIHHEKPPYISTFQGQDAVKCLYFRP